MTALPLVPIRRLACACPAPSTCFLTACALVNPGYYYRRPLDAAHANDYLVFLEGGYWCYDQRTCAERWNSSRALMSSKGWHTVIGADGLFDPRSPVYRGHLAFLRYCTSDGHMGDRSASPDTFGWHFRGRRVVAAVFASLQAHANLGLAGVAQRVFLGGASAGARGAMAALDYVQQYVPSSSLQVFGLLDSPLWIDQPPLPGQPFIGFAATTKLAYALHNSTGHVPAACRAAFPSEPWKCIFAQYRLPSVVAPYLLYASQYDAFQLDNNVGHAAPFVVPAEVAYVAASAQRTRAFFKQLAPTVAIYSSTCFNHAVSLSDVFFSERVLGESMAQMLRAVLSGQWTLRIVDASCDSANCGQGCPSLR